MIDFSAPVITASDTDTVNQGNTSALLTWNIIEEFPVSYEIHQNGVIIDEGYLTRDFITQFLGSLSSGEYNFTILIKDGVEHIETLQHRISVVSPSDLFGSLLFSVGIFATVIVILSWDYLRWKKKRMMSLLMDFHKAQFSKIVKDYILSNPVSYIR